MVAATPDTGAAATEASPGEQQVPQDPTFADEDLTDPEVQLFIGPPEAQVVDWAEVLAILERDEFLPEERGDGDATVDWLFQIVNSLSLRALYLTRRGASADGTHWEIKPERYDQEMDRLDKFETLCQLLLTAVTQRINNPDGGVRTRSSQEPLTRLLDEIDGVRESVSRGPRRFYFRFKEAEELRRRTSQSNYADIRNRSGSPQRGDRQAQNGRSGEGESNGQGAPRADAFAAKALRVQEENRFDHINGPQQSPPYHAAAFLSRCNQEIAHADSLPYVSVKLTPKDKCQFVTRLLNDATAQRFNEAMKTYQRQRLSNPIPLPNGGRCVFVSDLIHVWNFEVGDLHPVMRLSPQDCTSFPELFILTFPTGLSAADAHQRYLGAVRKFQNDGSTPPDQVGAELVELAHTVNCVGQFAYTVSAMDIGRELRGYIATHRSRELLRDIELQFETAEAQVVHPGGNFDRLRRFVAVAKRLWEAHDRATASREQSQAFARFDRTTNPRRQVFALTEQNDRRERGFRRHNAVNGRRSARVAALEDGHDSPNDSPDAAEQVNAVELDGEDTAERGSAPDGVDFVAYVERDELEADNQWGVDGQVSLCLSYDEVDLDNVQVVNKDAAATKLCFHCRQPGHLIADCPQRRTGGGGPMGRSAQHARIFRRANHRYQPASYDARGQPMKGPDGALYAMSRGATQRAHRVF